MAEISTDMLVSNLVQLRLNEVGSDISKCISEIARDRSISISKKKFTRIIYYVECHCINLESQIKRVMNDSEVEL